MSIQSRPTTDWPQTTRPVISNPPVGAVGVVLPIRDNLKFFKLAFHSIIDFSDYRYMLSIVDNMNGFSVRQYLESLRRNHPITILQYQQTHSQGAEWNLALRFMFSFVNVQYGVVLTPDVVMEPNWLSRLIKGLNDGAGNDIVLPDSNEAKDAVPGFCMAFKRATYEILGGFDESFHESGPAAQDFIERAKKAGLRAFWSVESYVHHFERNGWRPDDDVLAADRELLKTRTTPKEALSHE
jgi:hypothetical protein